MEINILVIENNKAHIAHVREHMQKTCNEFDANPCNPNIYPAIDDYEIIPKEISKFANNIHRDRLEIDSLYNYIEKLIEQYNINTILLDFFLCESEEEDSSSKAQDTTGGKLAKKFKKSKYKDIPIISFTKIDNKNLNEAPGTYSHVLFDLPKDFTKDFFTERGALFYKWIYKIEEYKKKKNEYCDIAVVCALQSELDAILDLNLDWEDNPIGNKLYHKGKLENYKVVAVSENKMGMPEASALTTRVIEKFNPKYVVMTGIAAGIDSGEQKCLELLMPDYIFNWQSGKYKVKKEDGTTEEKTIHMFEKDYRSEDTFLKYNNNIVNKNFAKKIIKNLDFNGFEFAKPTEIKIYNDGMVSGSAVVADSEIVSSEITQRKVNGIDMEAYGVVFACNNAPSKPKAIILKSICDFADENKGDKYQLAGMQISAQAFYILFTEFIKTN